MRWKYNPGRGVHKKLKASSPGLFEVDYSSIHSKVLRKITKIGARIAGGLAEVRTWVHPLLHQDACSVVCTSCNMAYMFSCQNFQHADDACFVAGCWSHTWPEDRVRHKWERLCIRPSTKQVSKFLVYEICNIGNI